MYEDVVCTILREEGIITIISLPCDRTKDLCTLLEEKFRYITISREEDGVGIGSGLALAGSRALLQMQSSGLGNSLNALLTLPGFYSLPLPILASWRGYYQEKIAAQIPFNSKIPKLLSLYGIAHTIIHDPQELSGIRDGIRDAYQHHHPHVILLSPKVWEGEGDVAPLEFSGRERRISLTYEARIREPVMKRADAIRVIADHLTDELVVSNIGVPSKELYAARDRDENFYMLGSYTQATPLGLGLALGSQKTVIVLDGDGSLLGTAALPVVAAEDPDNLTIIALDNGVFGSTGSQCSPAYRTVDLQLLAQASGISRTVQVHTAEELAVALLRKEEYRFIHVIIGPGNSNAPNIPYSATEIVTRFRRALSG